VEGAAVEGGGGREVVVEEVGMDVEAACLEAADRIRAALAVKPVFCVCVYYTHAHTCTHTHAHKHTHTYLHACKHIPTYTHTKHDTISTPYTYIPTHNHTNHDPTYTMYIHTYIHSHKARRDIHTHTYTYIHTYISNKARTHGPGNASKTGVFPAMSRSGCFA
jgi:hypothetical protein